MKKGKHTRVQTGLNEPKNMPTGKNKRRKSSAANKSSKGGAKKGKY